MRYIGRKEEYEIYWNEGRIGIGYIFRKEEGIGDINKKEEVL